MKFNMKKRFTLSFLLLTFVAQAQVIPVGFIKKGGYPSTGENPVTTNLLLYLDATRSASYDGTSTTAWKDISGQSNNATLYGSPAFGSGSFTFDNNKYALTSNLISSSLSSATFIAWVNPSQTQLKYTGIIVSRSGYADATAAVIGLDFNQNNSIGYVWNNLPSTYGWISGVQIPIDQWSMVALTITYSKAIVYLCKSSGIETAENPVNHPATSGSLKFYVGLDPNTTVPDWALKGKISTAMVYSTALSSSQIESIFNAQKAAFGL